MITEKDKTKASADKIKSGIRICEEALAKAEKYERLNENKDWKGYLEDLRIVSEIHGREVESGVQMLMDAPNNGHVKKDDFGKEIYVSSKADWTDFIVRHQIQKLEAMTWLKEPERILKMAALCREKLPFLKNQLAEIESEQPAPEPSAA